MPSQKNVLITGCGPNGIGGALAREFQVRGHRVFASGLSEPLIAGFRDDLGMETVVMDVTSRASVEGAVARVAEATGGRLHVLVNAAGVLHISPFADTPVEDARRVFDVNVLGVWAVTRAFLPLLLAAAAAADGDGDAVVANLASINSVLRPPFLAAYNASKAAVEVLGATLRTELAPLRVRVVTLKTGGVRTDLFNNASPVKLPQGSLYAPLREFIEERKMLEAGSYMDADQYARTVVSQLLRPSVKQVVWQGGMTTIAWILSWFGWDSLLDRLLIKGNRLDEIQRPK
ncbi:hypothetical protein DL766_001878 [Monosporascus sp. MC13-8B]|uniref:Ketoreductase domain-containing protein n=1 Tax=Monosporascus cannonballus TaxID=155416 RepID=A0ABY0GWQ1_9PEZI|nr:hypothetical protein DL762_009674 [Monosporascus cannonballus]RYO78147.1 hypothetical protein DL763_009762 [Monosporascus cannonballus]RYP36638.1 hypothetical protein DL766_001878 [Monosporascus sp. MC13-8B]